MAPASETVTPESYIRAETDRNFLNVYALSGNKINTLYHFRQPTPIDNKSANSIIHATSAELNADGGFTVFYGSAEACGKVANRLDVSEGWNLLMRVYRPGKSVLDGSYVMPVATPILFTEKEKAFRGPGQARSGLSSNWYSASIRARPNP